MTGTGSARGCVDSIHGDDLRVTTAYSNDEFESLTSAAKKAGMTIGEFKMFGVHALDLFLKLDSDNRIRESYHSNLSNQIIHPGIGVCYGQNYN